MRARELREQQGEARRLLESTHSALASDGDLLDDAERAEVDALVERLTALVISDDVEAVKAGIEALTKGTETLAERRMDRSIREALSGMSVDDEMFDEKASSLRLLRVRTWPARSLRTASRSSMRANFRAPAPPAT